MGVHGGSAGLSGVPRWVGGPRGGVGKARAWCLLDSENLIGGHAGHVENSQAILG